MVIFTPLVKLACSPLNKYSHNTSPVLILESLRVVCYVKLYLSPSESILEVNPLFEAHIPHRLLIFSVDQKLLNISKAKVSRMKMLRDYQNRIFLFG